MKRKFDIRKYCFECILVGAPKLTFWKVITILPWNFRGSRAHKLVRSEEVGEENIWGGVYMIPVWVSFGRYEFIPVPTCSSVFVYMIPVRNGHTAPVLVPVRNVVPVWDLTTFSTGISKGSRWVAASWLGRVASQRSKMACKWQGLQETSCYSGKMTPMY